MEIEYMTLIMTFINIAIIVAIIAGIIIGVKEFRKFLNRNKEIDKKLDYIMKQLEKNKND